MSDTHDIEMRAWADLAQRLQRELAEARAALRTAERVLSPTQPGQEVRYRHWLNEHAAAIKAAEDKP